MRDTFVKMKDGTIHCAPIWTYRPKEGWVELAGGPRLYFRDMATALTRRVQTRFDKIEDRDEIQRARDEGWNGT